MTEILNSFQERLAFALRLRGESNGSLARMTDVNPSTVGRWLAGSRPQPSVLTRIASELRVQPKWLLDGLGAMEQEDEQQPADLKETIPESRLQQAPAVYHSRHYPPPPIASLPSPALNAAASRLTEEQLEEILQTSIIRLREEQEPMLKLGYLTTLKACAADLERRICEETRE